ncbi:hypothetical protein KDX40_04690 [Burkholderia ambifaria]|uniref:hypothetical protein n=1 Tax=Burkholderia ambifaria TaxID=152480 RepID=UPI001B96FC93|nr:hypothetical protein [Burkholderia ambifaria]MBR8343035.1 hypothetical protein [Burkholderia ambifaria]
MTEREEFEAWAKKALGFWIDDEDTRVLNYVSGGCVPANSTEIALWDALRTGRRTTPDREAWQPIETAPKDCEVWAFNGEQGRMIWSSGDEWALWVWADELLSDVDPSPEQPTHWMLLPTAPNGDTK